MAAEEAGDEVGGEAAEDGRVAQRLADEVLGVVAHQRVGRERAEQVIEVVALQPSRAAGVAGV